MKIDWTQEKDMTLIRLFRDGAPSDETIGKAMGIGAWSIERRRAFLGLKRLTNKAGWTVEELALLHAMALTLTPYKEMAARLGRTLDAVTFQVARSGWRSKQVSGKPGPQASAEVQHDQRIKANILHLIDLKRAGHSARFTELRIDPDIGAAKRIHVSFFTGSACGSSMAQCSE